MTTSATSKDRPRHRVALRLLDHQIVGPDDQLLGNIDDLQLVVSDDGWAVTGLLVGPAALGQRLPGRLGRWTIAVWRRLQARPEAGPTFVPLSEVTEIDSAIRVNHRAADLLARSFALELWLRTYVISRIPGARGGGEDDEADADSTPSGPEGADASHRADLSASRVSAVLGSRVLAPEGAHLGVVTELFCAEPTGGRPRDHLRVTHIEYSGHRAGSELGYNDDSRQGPIGVGMAIRWWQRDSRVAPVGDVTAVDLQAGTISVTRHLEHVHPHRL